jgi:ABC-type phosphate transport system permease subunit
MKKSTLENVGIVSVITGFIGLLVFSPVLTFGFAYIGGLILKWIVGDSIANGFNTVFNSNSLCYVSFNRKVF